MSNTKEMRKLIESVIMDENTDQSYGPIETLKYIKLYLTTHKNLDDGDIENIINRIEHALKNKTANITEAVNDEEQKFIMIMDWFNAASGMPAKHNASDRLKEKYPGVEPWTWTAGYKAYLNAKK